MNLPEFATCFTKVVGSMNHTLTLTEPKPGDSVLKIGFMSIEGDEIRLEINVEKYLKKCSELEDELAALKKDARIVVEHMPIDAPEYAKEAARRIIEETEE